MRPTIEQKRWQKVSEAFDVATDGDGPTREGLCHAYGVFFGHISPCHWLGNALIDDTALVVLAPFSPTHRAWRATLAALLAAMTDQERDEAFPKGV